MNYQCPKCLWIHEVGPNDRRLPPWCPKCGADVKHDEWRSVHLPAPVVQPPPLFEEECEVTSVTSTGPRPWLNRKAATDRPAEPPPVVAPLPVRPAPAMDPDKERSFAWMKFGGAVLLAVAAGLAIETRKFVENGHEATGRVVTMDVPAKATASVWFRTPRIQYQANGQSHNIDPRGHEPGETVPLVYNRTDPTDVRLGTPNSLYQWAGLVAMAGASLLACGLYLSVSLAEQRKEAFDTPVGK